ncbi:MAG: SDR family oxidoreductase [Nitrospirota bacterium]
MLISFGSALVTGGAGFIGSHLVESLAAEGCRVTVLDNLSSGKMANLGSSAGHVHFIHGDIRDRKTLAQAAAGCEVVFHLAAVVSVVQTTEDPIGTAAINEAGSLHVLEAGRAAGARRVVFASSCSVYGDEPTLPKREDMRPRPLSPYAVQKLAVEHYLRVYQSLYGLETVSLRFFNVFGPRQDPSSPYSGVISIFIVKALTGEQPVIYGDGLQTRDFVFVGDVVQALILAAHSPSAPGRIFNVGTGQSVSINGLWATIASLSGGSAKPVHAPQRPGEVQHSLAAIDFAREHLQFAPLVSFEKGLEMTMRWYRKSLTSREMIL